MNKLLILFLFLSSLMFAQVTSSPSILIKIANSATVFGTNLSVGTQIYDIANQKLYAVKTKIISTETITTAALSLTLLNTAGHSSIDVSSRSLSTSTTDIVIADMTRTLVEPGTYSVQFNAQINIPIANYTTGFSTATAAEDLNLIYNDIMAIPVTATHALTFGNGEILFPGVYNVAGAASIAGTLTLNGNNEINPIFIIRANAGAFNTGAGTNVILTNRATAKNVFWIADGAIGLGANTTISGILFSHGAAVAGANSIVTGRLLTTSGAISFGQGALKLPTGESIVDFRSLSNFVMFTSSGGVANSGASVYKGDVGTALGAITSFETATVNGNIFQAGSTTLVTPINHMVTFSFYKNGVLILNSSRTRTQLPSDISLLALSTIEAGDTVDVRWKIDEQISDGIEISVFNRILTLIKVGN
ncbi:MAG: ice-binding family protein [Aquirufa antheringensis]|nr:ice-binding family protein [Aquirufa antheringensis]